MLDDPRVNFVISTHSGAKPGVDHLGIQVEGQDELREVYGRLKTAEGLVLEEGNTTCCYAQSEKSWIADPQGVAWETFLTVGESTVYGQSAPLEEIRDRACCGQRQRPCRKPRRAVEQVRSSVVAQVSAEAIGTTLLLAAVVGSGIMAERLSGANVGSRAAGERGGHRRRTLSADHHAVTDLGCAFQSGGDDCARAARHGRSRSRAALHRRADRRRHPRRLAGTPDVRSAEPAGPQPKCASASGNGPARSRRPSGWFC